MNANINNLLHEIFVALDIHFISCDEALIAQHFEEGTESSHIVLRVKDHSKDCLNVILLNQAPEHVSAIHIEQPNQTLLILSS